MKRRVPKGARLRSATKLPKRELLRRIKASKPKPPAQEGQS